MSISEKTDTFGTNKYGISLHPGGFDLTLAGAEAAKMKAGDSVLDIGCGTGASLALLRDRYGIIPYGIDSSEESVDYVKAHYSDIDIVSSDACSLPYEDGSFDHILLECVLTLINDTETALSEAVRVLRAGGKLIISILSNKTELDANSFGICKNGLLIPGRLVRWLENAGMKLLTCEDHSSALTQYLIDTIMEYGSIEGRIHAEEKMTGIPGASIFSCSSCGDIDPKAAGYSLMVFEKPDRCDLNGTPVDHLVAERIGVRPEELTQKAVEEYQLKAFRRTFAYARDHSRFYKSLFKDIDPDSILSMEDIRKLPVTSESDLAGSEPEFQCIPASMIDRNVTIPVLDQSSATVDASTSGTSGMRKRISYTQEDQERSIEFINRGFLTMDCKEGERMLVFMSGTSQGSIGDLVARAMAPLKMDIKVYGAVTDIAAAYAALVEFKPQVVEAIPWHAAALARYGTRYGNPESEFIRSVNLSADVVPDSIVARLEDLWGCTVHRHYGTTEMAIFGGVECIHHQGYHTRPCDILYEIPDTDDDGYGELLITTLDRKAMPLIRYRTGDIARFIDTPCPCGCRIRRIEKFVGRRSSLIELGSVSLYLSELADVLYSIPEVVDFDAAIITPGTSVSDTAIDSSGQPALACLEITVRSLLGDSVDKDFFAARVRTLFESHANNDKPSSLMNGVTFSIRYEMSDSFPGGYNLKKKVIRN